MVIGRRGGPTRQQSQQRSWPVPGALLLLSAFPVLAGVLRMVQLVGGPELIPADQRFAESPIPLAAHIVGATTYLVIGVLQLIPRFRHRHRAWHRRAGRLLVVAGMLVAGSAAWMTLFYAPKPGTGPLLVVLRLVFATAMTASLVLGVTTIRRGDVVAHRAWMIRAYAIGLAAGTQAFTGGIVLALFGTGALAGDLGKGAAWAINLAVAEWVIRRPAARAASNRADRPSRLTADVGAVS